MTQAFMISSRLSSGILGSRSLLVLLFLSPSLIFLMWKHFFWFVFVYVSSCFCRSLLSAAIFRFPDRLRERDFFWATLLRFSRQLLLLLVFSGGVAVSAFIFVCVSNVLSDHHEREALPTYS